jgi:DNA-binding HxlR family transcriptional regulator
MKIQYNLPCNIAQTLNIIGDKWSLLILHQLLMGRETFKDMQDNLAGIPTNLLSDRLKTMEDDGLIERSLYQTHPPRYKYTLTEKGSDLDDVFGSIMLWGQKHLNTCYKKLVHTECSHTVEHVYYCPQCGKNVTMDEISVIDTEN